MNTFLTKAGLAKAGVALAMGSTMLSLATPAEAQRWYGGGWRGGRTVIVRDRGAGPAIAAGIAGLAVGAAIASSRDRYYDYGPRYGYGPGYGYYGPARRSYYYGPGPRYYNYYGPSCWVERRYDPYYGGPVRVEVCR